MPLPKKPDPRSIGESRSQAITRFLSLEKSLHLKGKLQQVDQVVQEYMELGHAELVPAIDLNKEPKDVFYLPTHVVYKDSKTSTKITAVFDGSAKSSTGISFNDTLGPTVPH